MIVCVIGSEPNCTILPPAKDANREQRRKYLKSLAHSKYASECPKCHKKARLYIENSKEEFMNAVVKCEYCDEMLCRIPNSYYPEYTFVKIYGIEEDEKNEKNENNAENS